MLKEEKLKIYTELLKNTTNNKGINVLYEAINNTSINRINKLDKLISVININISGFGIELKDTSEITFIKYEEHAEKAEELVIMFKIKDEGKIKIYDIDENEVSSISAAIESAKGAKIKRYYLVETYREDDLSVQVYFNINKRFAMNDDARKWALEIDSNCHPRYNKEQGKILFNNDIYLTIKYVKYMKLLDDEQFIDLSHEQFIEKLNQKLGDSNMLVFNKYGVGTFTGIFK